MDRARGGEPVRICDRGGLEGRAVTNVIWGEILIGVTVFEEVGMELHKTGVQGG